MVRDDLGEGRLVALAVSGRAGVGRHRPRGLHAHDGALERAEAAHLDVAGHPDAEELPVAAREPGGLLLPERVVLRDLERLGQRAVVLPAVVALARRRGVGEGVGGDEVLPPHRLGRHAELLGGEVDDALDVVAALGPAGASVGRHRRRVGEDAGRAEIDVGDAVDADAHHERQVGDEREDRVGADVGEDVHPEGGDGAVPLDRRLHVGHVGAAVRRRHHVLDPRLDPPERQAVELRHRRQRGVLRVDAELHPEPAADLGGDHADLVLLEPEQGGEPVAHRVRRLGRGPDDEAAGGGIRRGQRGAPLERHAAQPLADHALAHDLEGPGEGGVRVAGGDAILVLHVARRVGVDLGGAGLPRLERVAHGGQRLPVDDDVGGARRRRPPRWRR